LGPPSRGESAFLGAEPAVLSRFGGLGVRSTLLATGAGVAMEAPVFGLAQRSLHRFFLRRDPKASAQEIFRNVLSFGALRGAGLGVRLSLAGIPESALLYGRATFPIFHHAASFGALHTLHELDRRFHPEQ